MPRASGNYWINLWRLARRQQLLRPLAVTYYVTTLCNLNCAYCEDFGARRNGQNAAPLPLTEALRVLRVIRTGADSLILTGGEPLLHPQIDELVGRARHDLAFRGLTMLTNASLLHEHQDLPRHLTRLVISLDSMDAGLWSSIIQMPQHVTHRILDNIRDFAARQRQQGYRMALNCVITPQTLPGVRELVRFCREHNLLLSLSPQAVMNWPSYDLLVADEYKALLAEIIAEKKRGAPILGSLAYLNTLLDFKPYACYPTLVPRVMPHGELVYPCRPIEKDHNGRGGQPCSLLDVPDWSTAMRIAAGEYGEPPLICASCFQQCYAEPSLMQARPFDWLAEWLRFPASRAGDLPTFAPG